MQHTLYAAVWLLSGLWSTDAAAQTFLCPTGPGPGEVQVGTTGGGNSGLAITPICALAGGGSYGWQDPGNSYEYDPLQSQIEAQSAWLAWAEQAQIAAEQAQIEADRLQAQLDADPRYAALREGLWEYASGEVGGERRCGAFFGHLDGAIAITGQTGDPNGTYLTFIGSGISAPAKVRKIKVTLEQTDSEPQTVVAFQHRAGSMGAITFSVPLPLASVPALFLEEQSFRLLVKRKEVFALSWRGGRAAAEQIQRCASG